MWTINENKNCNYLEQQFDWVKRMSEVPQDKRYHAEGNVAIHTQMVLTALEQQASYQALAAQDQEILWASALLHDVEKYSTTVLEPDGSITSHGHARKGALTSRQLLYTTIATPFAIREQISGLVRHHGLPLWIFEKPDPLKALVKASMEVNTQWLALLARADMIGRICDDQAEMLYRIDCFEAFCQENNCWGSSRPFATTEAMWYYMQNDDAYVDYVPFEEPAFEVILLSGLPGAGKDTFIKKTYPDMPVISLDKLRNEQGVLPTDQAGNGRVVQAAKELARVYLRKQQSFVWNATNTTAQMRMQLIELFNTYKARTHIVYIEVPYAQLHQQNQDRDAIVPHAAMEKLIYKLEVPKLWEAHRVTYVI
ncbi:AAA family ATPase [Mucilaginibacter sp. 22184]|uniref:AAA family ATPase n=1 Tax=Mucilaginibacter sp. 22184 TaxID=3453887 RepID=UPI003F86A337